MLIASELVKKLPTFYGVWEFVLFHLKQLLHSFLFQVGETCNLTLYFSNSYFNIILSSIQIFFSASCS